MVVQSIIPCTRDPHFVFEGWLTKKKPKSDKWDLKLCILTTESFQYCTRVVKGNFTLADCQILSQKAASVTGELENVDVKGEVGSITLRNKWNELMLSFL